MHEEIDFDSLRQTMVDRQLLPRGINDKRLIDVMRKIPRHTFVPLEYQKSSYGDFPLPIGNNQTISQPYMVALMTQILDIQPTDRILEIGTGSGYQTAILAHLAEKVYSLERIEMLAKKTKALLEKQRCTNIEIKAGDGTLGWKENAPYDKIIVTAAASSIPEPLIEQMKLSGKLAIPVNSGFGQTLELVTKKHNSLHREKICGCTFVPLIGQYSYKS